MKKIDWKSIWEDFDTWMINHHPGRMTPSLVKQQCKIQRLINAQVREIVQKKI
ncbi:hypothetical protein LCGC14_0220920 [marine sediment metagenome]|uniref:Uncharacterized protein n=1 Tax=marine sediment metagenome TaxID=412755 RepID=A0A0F9UHS3_9ZZZZ